MIAHSDKLASDTLDAYESARRELLGQLLAGDDTPLSLARAQALLAQVEHRLGELQSKLIPLHQSAFNTAAHIMSEDAIKELKKQIPKNTIESLNSPGSIFNANPKINHAIVDQVIKDGCDKVKLPIGQLKDEIKREMTQAVIQGESVQKATKRILSITDDSGQGLPVIRPFKSAERRAETIARTEIMKAGNSAALMQHIQDRKDFPALVIEWNAKLCKATCHTCQTLNGKKTRPGTNFPGGPLAPPLHPNCRCSLSPIIMDEEEFIKEYGPTED